MTALSDVDVSISVSSADILWRSSGSNAIDTSNSHNSDGIISAFYDYDLNSRLVKVTDDEDTDPPEDGYQIPA